MGGGHGHGVTYKGITIHQPKRWHSVTGKGLCAVMCLCSVGFKDGKELKIPRGDNSAYSDTVHEFYMLTEVSFAVNKNIYERDDMVGFVLGSLPGQARWSCSVGLEASLGRPWPWS